MDHMTQATPFSGMVSLRCLTFDIACKGTKFDDSNFSRSRDISGVWNYRMRHVALTTPN